MYVLPRKILVALVGQGSHDMKPVMERKVKDNVEPRQTVNRRGPQVGERTEGPLLRCSPKKNKKTHKKTHDNNGACSKYKNEVL